MNYNKLDAGYWQQQRERIEQVRMKIASRTNVVYEGRVIPEDADLTIGTGRRLHLAVMFIDLCRSSETRWIVPVHAWHVREMVSFVAVFGLIGSAVCVILVVVPRLGGEPKGLIYWGAIVRNQTARDYSDRVARQTDADLTRELLTHTYELAKIAKSKYRFVAGSIWAGAVGSLAALVYLGLLK